MYKDFKDPGLSTAPEALEYFSNLNDAVIPHTLLQL